MDDIHIDTVSGGGVMEKVPDLVEIGYVVTVQFPSYQDGTPGETMRFKIVDIPVIDSSSSGLLYVESPIGQAVFGRGAGERVVVKTPDMSMRYELDILAVRAG